jgi:hypothetical protein
LELAGLSSAARGGKKVQLEKSKKKKKVENAEELASR